MYDVIIVGGGPAGLAGALMLGRARRRVLLCDAGARRNAAATRMHNFVTRDGTPPDEFRRVAREQLAEYPNVELLDARVQQVTGEKGELEVRAGERTISARRLLLCTGMIDEVPKLPGADALWGKAIFQCPYCHGWEVRDRRWGYLARPDDLGHLVPFVTQLRGWTEDVTLFTSGAFELPDESRRVLAGAGVRVEEAPVVGLIAEGERLVAVELAGGGRTPCEALYAHPAQRQTELILSLGLTLEAGFVQVDPMRRETSMPGVYAAGDLTTRMQAALPGAATAMQAASMIHVDLAMEQALERAAP